CPYTQSLDNPVWKRRVRPKAEGPRDAPGTGGKDLVSLARPKCEIGGDNRHLVARANESVGFLDQTGIGGQMARRKKADTRHRSRRCPAVFENREHLGM